MKIALCFIISYDHIINKEEIWKEWIEHNKDIINVYFYYTDLTKIRSPWILKHTIPINYIQKVSYYHVVPAYLSLFSYAMSHDSCNTWFCMLTDSCCPIVSPTKFRYLFYKNYTKSIMNWKAAWWNEKFHKRANLAKLPAEFRLANDPWFILKKENVVQILHFTKTNKTVAKTICDGGLANESLFAIILYGYKQLTNENVISSITHITDWSRMTSATSPYLFKDATEKDILFLDREIEKNHYAVFCRKMSPDFPDAVIRRYIYEKNKCSDDILIITEPWWFTYKRWMRLSAWMVKMAFWAVVLGSTLKYFHINSN